MTAAVLLRHEPDAVEQPPAAVTVEQLVALTPLIMRIALSMIRKRRESPTDASVLDAVPDKGAGPERTADSHAGLDELWQALDRLPALNRAVVILREIDGLSYEEIGAALDLPLSTVKTRLFRGRRVLANELRPWV